MIQRAKKRIVFADHKKFNRLASIKICDLSDIDMIVASEELRDEIKQKYADYGIEIVTSEINKNK